MHFQYLKEITSCEALHVVEPKLTEVVWPPPGVAPGHGQATTDSPTPTPWALPHLRTLVQGPHLTIFYL